MTDERHHHRAVAAAICRPPSDWKRPPGRPNHAWLRAIESDLRPLNIGPSYMRGRSQSLENAGVRLWTRLRSRRACGRQEMSVYTCVCRVSVRDASISPELYVAYMDVARSSSGGVYKIIKYLTLGLLSSL